ncbi:disease resistance protein At4g27190-like [Silene latifolia]|uniref:disease resistance protein At4g27190-like n=1 Tax=Silene latifolia TaxID=37657 RepID=UPI003D789085
MGVIWTGIANFLDGIIKKRRREIPDSVAESQAGNLSFPQPEQQDHKRRKVTSSKETGVSVRLECEIMTPISGWLKDDRVNTIGIYGMGGIGKTTLMKQLHNRLKNHAAVQCKTGSGGIAWVTVGMNFTVYNLQHRIAKAVGLDLQDEKDATRRAARLHAFLVRVSWYVIFLDDLWGEFRVDQVGIPTQCNLIIISRSLHVCRALRCQKVIRVSPLPQDEAWQLFYTIVGNSVLDTKEILPIGKRLCDICGGVPLAINGLAKKMRGVADASGWSKALDSLIRNPMGDAALDATFSSLRRSYDNLSNPKLKTCLLYCALYPMGDAIRKQELIRLWIGEMLIDDVESLQAQYDMGHSILNKLLNSCILETSHDESTVKIHYLIKLMALSIAGDSFRVSNTPQLTKNPLESESWESFKVISSIKSIPSATFGSPQNCPSLSTLLLQHSCLSELPDSIFVQMSSLRVLNLSHTSIQRLPSSTGKLHKLRLLDISHCPNLKVVPSIAKLEKLRFLNLCQTPIKHVPRSLYRLEMLKELNLSSASNQLKISWDVLISLPRLKRLSCSITNSGDLQRLKTLEILGARFVNCIELTEYVRSNHWRSLKSFHLQVGHSRDCTRPYTRAVSLNGCSLNGLIGKPIVFPDNIQEFTVNGCQGFHNLNLGNSYDDMLVSEGQCGLTRPASPFSSLVTCTITRCHDVEQLFTASCIQKLPHLESIEIEDCKQLKEVIADETVQENGPINLPRLRRFVLYNLPQLNSICKTQLVSVSLCSLEIIGCPRLKQNNILSSS